MIADDIGKPVKSPFEFISRNGTQFRVLDRCLAWNDPKTGEWEPKVENTAGSYQLLADLRPRFYRETDQGIMVFGETTALRITYIGQPLAYSVYVVRGREFVLEGGLPSGADAQEFIMRFDAWLAQVFPSRLVEPHDEIPE